MTDEPLKIVAIAAYGTMSLILISNLIYLWRRHVARYEGRLPRVSVLIPARNEAHNLRRLIPTLLEQDIDDMEVIVYDDDSHDDTWHVIELFAGGHLRGVRGHGLPPGWVGKNYALYRAAEEADGEVFVFLDADAMLLHPGALRSLVQRYQTLPDRGALAVLPRLGMGGGRMLVSLIPNAVLASLPWVLTRALRISSFGALNGQCWMIDSESYRELQPHERHKDEVLEDVVIGRYLVRQGYTTWLVSSCKDLTIRMYDSNAEAWRGFRKNAYLLLGGSPFRFLIGYGWFAAVFVVLPLLFPALYLWMILLKAATDRMAGFSPLLSIVAPVSYLMGAVLYLDSALHHWQGKIEWKGRLIKRGETQNV